MQLKKSEQTIICTVLSLVFFLFILFSSAFQFSAQLFPLIFILVPIIFLITFVNTDVALIILIFSMLLSPEIKLADIPHRAVVVRIDDFLVIITFFSWLAKMAVNKQLSLLKHTALNLPIIAYIVTLAFSSAIGILLGNVHPLKGAFYMLKYIEYFMLFFMVTNNIRDKDQIKTFTVVFLITAAITCAYALATVGKMGRATAPFEGMVGEPNTLGGYIVLLFAITAGIFLYTRSRAWQFCCVALAGLMFLTLLQTLSRGSYLSFIPMCLSLIILTKKRKVLFVGVLILGMLFLWAKAPLKVIQRVTGTFVGTRMYTPLGGRLTLDRSASARIESWKAVFGFWKKRPVLGYGISGIGLVDSQYPLVLGEGGAIGFWMFLWMLARIFSNSRRVLRNAQDEHQKGMALGFLAGFIGLLFHGLAANTFIIVRIMEPFWFLAAMVVMLPHVEESSEMTLEQNS